MQQNRLLERQLAQLRAEARQNRNVIRDLKNENFVLKDRIETAKVERDRIGIPRLPVETREPAVAAAPVKPKRPGYEVVGVDRNGAEIVYVGDAAKNESIRPRLIASGRSETSSSSSDRSSTSSSSGATEYTRDGRPLAPVPTVDERLPVSKSIPTIANQLRKAAPTSVPAGGIADPQADYRRYYAALRAGNHAYAITGFRNFIKRYPDHDYADNAQYWLGEAFYDRKDYAAALVEFRRVVARYPRGNKVPDALLKIGYCYTSLKEPAKARAALQQIITVYPKGRAAELANTQLAKLGAGGK